jgi:hypothetical protein
MVATRLRHLLVAVLVAAAVSTGIASGAARVIGGNVIQVQAAPWAVFVEQQASASTTYLCSGSIIDPTHILTAAHCVYNGFGRRARPSQLGVEAGVSNFSEPLPGDVEQDKSVSKIRVHPGYVWTGRSEPDDVAVLVLSSPLDLSGPTARAVALPAENRPFPEGLVVGLAGFGRERPAVESSGPLARMTPTIAPQGSCPTYTPRGILPDNAIAFCASAARSAVCEGDSGSGLVTTGETPTILGVADAGAVDCRLGTDGVFTDVGAPEILRFIKGDDHPPTAPRDHPSTFVRLAWDPPLVDGNTLSCFSGAWSRQGRVTYSFADPEGTVFQHGPKSTFTIPAADTDKPILCDVSVRNPGGLALAASVPTPIVRRAPALRIGLDPAAGGLRGHDLTLDVSLTAPAGLWGKFGVCAVPPSRVGGRICASAQSRSGRATRFRFRLTFRLKATAPPGIAQVVLDAVGGIARLTATAAVTISRP